MGFFTWIGRLILWCPPLTPIGIWRSLRHHRRKAQAAAIDAMRKEMATNG